MRKNGIRVGKDNPNSSHTDKNGCSISIEKYFLEFSRFVPLEAEKERELLEQVQNGNKKAERELFFHHARFVISVAKKMHNERRFESSSLCLNDFVQWGNMGLVRAMYKVNVSGENRFLSYAIYHIEGVILDEYAKTGTLIRLPINQRSFIKAFRKEQAKTVEPLLELYEGNEDVILTDLYGLLSDHNKAALLIPKQFHGLDDSLSSYICFDDEMSQATVKAESVLFSEFTADKEVILESFQLELCRSLETLAEREAFILVLFFGLGSFYGKALDVLNGDNTERRKYYETHYSTGVPLEEIGEMLNIMPERVRQVKDKALQRLRHTSRSKLLLEYLG